MCYFILKPDVLIISPEIRRLKWQTKPADPIDNHMGKNIIMIFPMKLSIVLRRTKEDINHSSKYI